ncbi:hypothetical protein [Methanopyrus kandleri]|uniref:Uncharacterized protein conserved in archaea n=2 Tax=Methanopyrus kandleri TaxID=2320 RepID=Q8TY74_METKA|nr:hypothetical protein [Methanopyrus kandleri]AAM01646.1 Uncharacterized protein conserved in archaea [Methanopyrus kandleri AV19]HII70410.1 hypothetical protein [Methanopyrus kandleri]
MTIAEFVAVGVLTLAIIVAIALIVRSREVPEGEGLSMLRDKISLTTRSDVITKKVDELIECRVEELIDSWGLATTEDVEKVEKRVDALDRKLNELEQRFNEFRNDIRRKIERLESRLRELSSE